MKPPLPILLAAFCWPWQACDRPAEQPPVVAGQATPPHAKWAQHQEFRDDLARERHASDGGGAAWIDTSSESPTIIQASGRARWRVMYRTGALGIAAGGSIFFMPEPFWGWSAPQDIDSQAPGYVQVSTAAEGVELATSTLGLGLLRIEIGGRALAPDEVVVIDYGAGPALARADRFAERDARLWLAVDGDGDGVRAIVEESPRLEIVAGEPARLSLTLTSTAAPGDPARLTVAVLDHQANLCSAFRGELKLIDAPPDLNLPEHIELGAEQGGRCELRFRAANLGVVRLHARAESDGQELLGSSNPLWVTDAPPSILWGDLHGHSNFSDGTGLPEDYFRYARDVAGLDLVALTDHDHFGVRFLDAHPELWEQIKDQVHAFHEPGRFVTLLGYEWTSWLHGHRHVLYFQDQGEVLSSLDPDVETPDQLWASLEGQRALTFAHHSAGEPVPTNWSFRPDPRFEPVTEIVSVHGSSEARDAPRPVRGGIQGNFVRDVLDAGVRLGFIGSGDSHDGHPGLPQLSASSGYLPARAGGPGEELGTGGLAAILSPERTRPGIYRALMDRRVYATNGPRILLQVSLEGLGMGRVALLADLPAQPNLEVLVIACAPLSRIELIQKGAGVFRQDLQGELEIRGELPLTGLRSGDFVYLRAVQQDGGTAWSSPIFIE